MPKNIVDQDVFTTTVQAIQDGDPLNEANLSDVGVQHLANRTANLNNRKNAARYGLSGTGLTNSVLVTLAEQDDSNGLYALSADRVQVPRAGRYLIALFARVVSNDDTANNPLNLELAINLSTQGSLAIGGWTRWSTTLGHDGIASAIVEANIATPASDTIGVLALPTFNAMDVTIGRLSIVQVV